MFPISATPTDKLPVSLSRISPNYTLPLHPNLSSFSFHQHQIGSSNKEIMKTSTGSVPPEKDFWKHVHNRGVNRTSLQKIFFFLVYISLYIDIDPFPPLTGLNTRKRPCRFMQTRREVVLITSPHSESNEKGGRGQPLCSPKQRRFILDCSWLAGGSPFFY